MLAEYVLEALYQHFSQSARKQRHQSVASEVAKSPPHSLTIDRAHIFPGQHLGRGA